MLSQRVSLFKVNMPANLDKHVVLFHPWYPSCWYIRFRQVEPSNKLATAFGCVSCMKPCILKPRNKTESKQKILPAILPWCLMTVAIFPNGLMEQTLLEATINPTQTLCLDVVGERKLMESSPKWIQSHDGGLYRPNIYAWTIQIYFCSEVFCHWSSDVMPSLRLCVCLSYWKGWPWALEKLAKSGS